MQVIAYWHIAIESQSMRSNKGDGSIDLDSFPILQDLTPDLVDCIPILLAVINSNNFPHSLPPERSNIEIVKLRTHRWGFPARYFHFILCPSLPAGRHGPRLSRFGRTGHSPVKV